MPVLKRQKGQISIGELEEKIANGTRIRTLLGHKKCAQGCCGSWTILEPV